MSNLVNRLRGRLTDAPMATELMMDEAADRIEHLERVLAQARECLTSTVYFQEQSAPDVIAAIDEALKS